MKQFFLALAIWVFVELGCKEITTARAQIVDVDLSRDWFVKLGISLYSDEPDSALRAFSTALLLLDEELLTVDEDQRVRSFIYSWVHTTKTSRVGAFRTVSTMVQFDDSEPVQVRWVLGFDLRRTAYQTCMDRFPENEDACDAIHEQLLAAEESYRPPAKNGVRPPRYIPDDMYENFTRGYAAVINIYRDDSQPGYYQEWTRRELDEFAGLVRSRNNGTNYPQVDRLLYELLDSAPGPVHNALTNQSVAIMGSATPWYEVLALEFGARETVTVEYNRLKYRHPRMRTLTPAEYWPAGEPAERFGLALSISSFEHDGLGRYGDPLAPDGDMAAMLDMERALLPGGLLLLAVPVAADAIVWNCHRIYGRRRLTALLARWTVVRVLGLTDSMFEGPGPFPDQPVFILENTRPARPLDFGPAGAWARALEEGPRLRPTAARL